MKLQHFYFIGTNETAPISMLKNMKSVQFHQFRYNKNGAVSLGPVLKSETVSIGPVSKLKQFHQNHFIRLNSFIKTDLESETVSLGPIQEVKQFHWDRSRRCNSFIRTEIKNETVSLGQFQNFKQFHLFRIIKNETVSSVPLYHFRN